MWCDKYIGIPFKPNGYDYQGADCFGLVNLVYREVLNITLPRYDVYTRNSIGCLKEVARTMNTERDKWIKVEQPRMFDVVLLRTGTFVWHCGMVISRYRMLHVMEGINSCIEDFTGIMWKERVDGFLRYPV
jgi:cell wall-associated NlpC family hydrolase